MITAIIMVICCVAILFGAIQFSKAVTKLDNPIVKDLESALKELINNFKPKSAFLIGSFELKAIMQIQKMDNPLNSVRISIFKKEFVIKKENEINNYLSSHKIESFKSINKFVSDELVESIEFITDNNIKDIHKYIDSIISIIQCPSSKLLFSFMGSKPLVFKEVMKAMFSKEVTN